MAAKSLDIHPSALAELKSSISWYLERNETTANKFVQNRSSNKTRTSIAPTLANG